MNKKLRAKIKDSTQDAIVIKDIVDDLVITKNGKVDLIIQTTAVNFDLLAEYEQESKINAFAGLLNSLNFNLQIVILTHPVNIKSYVDYLGEELKKQINPQIKRQMEIYMYFVQNMIIQNEVLDKKFYVVISYTHPFGPGDNQHSLNKILEQGKIYLYPKRDHVMRLLNTMGLFGHQLTTDELIEMYYKIYNNI